MQRYVIKRLLQSIFVLFGAATVVFFIVRLTGDPVTLMLSPSATVEDAQLLREQLGLDAPLYAQYFSFMANLLKGDLGVSLRFNEPTWNLIVERLPATLELASTALIFALVIAFPLGIASATRRGSWIDNIGSVITLLGQSVPVFWLGMLLILQFSVELRWLPSYGRVPGSWQHLILPTITLGMFSAALTARMLRSAMLEVLNMDYVRTAKAKGLARSKVVYKHVLRNALVPVITIIGIQMGTLLSGSVVTETVFAWPGIGRLVINAIETRDFPLVQACIIVISGIFIVINLLVDVFYAVIDPRVQYN